MLTEIAIGLRDLVVTGKLVQGFQLHDPVEGGQVIPIVLQHRSSIVQKKAPLKLALIANFQAEHLHKHTDGGQTLLAVDHQTDIANGAGGRGHLLLQDQRTHEIGHAGAAYIFYIFQEALPVIFLPDIGTLKEGHLQDFASSKDLADHPFSCIHGLFSSPKSVS